MRLAIIGDEIDQELNVVTDVVTAYGFDGIEVRSVWNTRPHEFTTGQLHRIRNSIHKKRLSVVGFDSPCFKTRMPHTANELESSRAAFLQAVEQARVLDAPFVRVFSFYRDNIPDPTYAAKVIRDLVSDIVPDDLLILFETGTRTNTPTMKHMAQFIEILADNRVGVLWDPGNSVFSGFHMHPFLEYELYKDLIKHIHVKDPIGQIEYTRLGDGDLNWRSIIRKLRADRYGGYLSIETHWRPGRKLSQEQRDDPWLNSFSNGGYHASVECMKQLRNYIVETR